MKFKHPNKQGHVVVPHPRKDMPIGTLRTYIGKPDGTGGKFDAVSRVCPQGRRQRLRAAARPDFSGCFCGRRVADLPRMAQEAVELHFEGEDIPIPTPSVPEAWGVTSGSRAATGCWLNFNLARIRNAPVRLNISCRNTSCARSTTTRKPTTRRGRVSWHARQKKRCARGRRPALPGVPRQTSRPHTEMPAFWRTIGWSSTSRQ